MIQEFVTRFKQRKGELTERWRKERPGGYRSIVRAVIEIVTGEEYTDEQCPDPERIHVIDDGDYQGTLLFVIAAKGYQPYDYWYVKVSYGSCSGCDTFRAIEGWGDEITEKEVEGYLTLALHVAQRLKKTAGWGED